MKDILTIEVTNHKAYKLLEDLEDMEIIRVVRKPPLLSQLRGKIHTRISNKDIDKQLDKIRKEWQRDI